MAVVKTLHRLRIPYAITGGYAASVWGRPRSTFDVDVIIELPRSKVDALVQALRKISRSGYLDEGAANQAVERNSEFNFIHPTSGLKIDFWVAGDDAFSQSKLQRRSAKRIMGQRMYFLSPEDLILSKLRWHKESGSELQLRDIEAILRVQRNLDRRYLTQWARRQTTFRIFQELWTKHRT